MNVILYVLIFCLGYYLLITSLRHTVGDIPSCDANTLEK